MIIIISPHPDDDIICCSGIISRNSSNVKVVYVTDGRKGSPRREDWGEKLALERMNEAYNALNRLGVKNRDNIIFLGNEDGSVSKNFIKIYNQLSKLLQEKDITEIYFPSPLDEHPDHSAIGKMILSIIKKVNGRRICLYMYTIHKHQHPIVNPRYLFVLFRSIFFRLTWKRICIKVDDLEAKLEALRFHKSQIWYMSEDVKKLASKDHECFYFRCINKARDNYVKE